MASVPNRVYPMNEYNEIKVQSINIVKSTIDTGAAMGIGDIYLVTGASGLALWIKTYSGSTNSIGVYYISGSWLNSGSVPT